MVIGLTRIILVLLTADGVLLLALLQGALGLILCTVPVNAHRRLLGGYIVQIPTILILIRV